MVIRKFYFVQMLDGVKTTSDNFEGHLPKLIKGRVLNLLRKQADSTQYLARFAYIK